MYTSEADFHKPEIYGGRARVWATEWDVFHCTPSRGGRGRRAAVDIFGGVFFECLVGFRFFFVFFTSNAHGLLQVRGKLASCTSLLVPGGVQRTIIYLDCLPVCATFVVYADSKSFARAISTNPGSMEAGEFGLTRGTCFVARCLEVVAVAGLLVDSR